MPRRLLLALLLLVTATAVVVGCELLGDSQGTQWSVLQLPLTSTLSCSGPCQNPYTDLQVTAVFRPPVGAPMTQYGFLETTGTGAGQTWVVRFTPTVTGVWTYSTAAFVRSTGSGAPGPWSPWNDPGLTKSGSVQAGVPARSPTPMGTPHGFVRVDAAHPTSFVFDDGTRLLPVGQTYYEIGRNARWNGDWKSAIDGSAAAGFTKVRIAVFGWNTAWTTTDPAFPLQCSDANSGCQSAPFVDWSTNTGHRSLDPAHFAALDAVVEEASAGGLQVDLELFVDSPTAFHCGLTGDQCTSGGGWPDHGDWVDDTYVTYVVARYSAFPNVEWTLANEFQGTPHPQASVGGYWDHVAQVVRWHDPYFVGARGPLPLTIHPVTNPVASPVPAPVFPFLASSGHAWATTIDVQWGTQIPLSAGQCTPDQWTHAAVQANLAAGNGAYPVADEEYGYLNGSPLNPCVPRPPFNAADNRAALWTLATSGGYGSGGDSTPTPITADSSPVRVYDSGDWNPQSAYSDVAAFNAFWQTNLIPYWAMRPDPANTPLVPTTAADGSVHSTYALSLTGKVTVVYQTSTASLPSYNQGPSTGQITIKEPAGRYAIYAANPTSRSKRSAVQPIDWVVSATPITVTYCQNVPAPGCRASAAITSADWVLVAVATT